MGIKPGNTPTMTPPWTAKSHAASSLSVSVPAAAPNGTYPDEDCMETGSSDESDESESMSTTWTERNSLKPSFLDKFIHFGSNSGNTDVVPNISVENVTNGKDTGHGASIFKRMISRKTLIPKTKAFKRISADMQVEQCPLDEEIHHELLTTMAMREDDLVLNRNLHNIHNTENLNNIQHVQSVQNRHNFEIIHRANESWNRNRRKSSNSITSQTPTNASLETLSKKPQLLQSKTKSAINIPSFNRKRKRVTDDNQQYDTNHTDQGSEHGFCVETDPETDTETSHLSWMIGSKRRLVSASVTNSPKSPAMEPFSSRRNSVLFLSLQSASDELENMSLK